MDIWKLELVNKQSSKGRKKKDVTGGKCENLGSEDPGVAWHDRSSATNFTNLILDLSPHTRLSWEAKAGGTMCFIHLNCLPKFCLYVSNVKFVANL